MVEWEVTTAVKKVGANAAVEWGALAMVVGGAWMRGASGVLTAGEEGRSTMATGSSHALKMFGMSGNVMPYFSARYSPMPSSSSLTDGREPTPK